MHAVATPLSGDGFWSLATGNWILAHHAIPHADPFSYTVQGREWFATEWGADLLLATLVKWTGMVGVTTFILVCDAGVVVLVGLVGLGRRVEPWRLTAGLVVAIAGTYALTAPRALATSGVCVVAVLACLVGMRARPWLLGVLVAVTVLWANLHGSAILALFLCAIEFAYSFVALSSRWQQGPPPLPKRLAGLAIAGAGLGLLVTPYGPAGLWHNLAGIVLNPGTHSRIPEWGPPQHIGVWAVTLGVAVGMASLVAWRKASVWLPAAFGSIALAVSSMASQRLTGYALLVAAMAIACGTSRSLAQEPHRYPLHARTWLTAGAAAVVCVVLVTTGAPPQWSPTVEQALDHLPPSAHPKVFSIISGEDYLVWKGVPVFYDGRQDLYATTPAQRVYDGILSGTMTGKALLAFGTTAVVVPRSPIPGTYPIYLDRELRSQGWQIYYENAAAIVLQPPQLQPTARRNSQ